jgi:hypothetical protein
MGPTSNPAANKKKRIDRNSFASLYCPATPLTSCLALILPHALPTTLPVAMPYPKQLPGYSPTLALQSLISGGLIGECRGG